MNIKSFLNDYLERGVKDISYNIFSTIEETFPRACVSFTTHYLTPDALGLHRGKACPLTVSFNEKNSKKLDFFIDYWEVKGTEIGMRIDVYLTFLGALGKITNQRKSYKDKNAGDIVNDVVKSDIYLNRYKKEIERSDHSFNCFRNSGESAEDFINNTVAENTLIDNSKPYFFVGLDNVVRFVSTNSIAKKGDNIKASIDLGVVPENKSVKLGLTQKGIDKKKLLNLKANSYKINCGEKGDFADLKRRNYIYSPNDLGNFKEVEVVTTTPKDKNKSKFPILGNFLFFTDSTSGKMFGYRPHKNIKVEVYNEMSESLSQMIKIQVKNAIPDFSKNTKEFVSAGCQVYVNTLYAYSALNGLYAIKEIEYMYTNEAVTVNMVLVRSFYDMQYPKNKESMEITGDRVYGFAPVCEEGELLD